MAANVCAELETTRLTAEGSVRLLSSRFINESLTILDEKGLVNVNFPEAGHLQSSLIELSGARIVERVDKHLAVVLQENPCAISLWQIRNGKATPTNLEARFYHPILAVLGWKKPELGRLVLFFQDRLVFMDYPSLQIIHEIHEQGAGSTVVASCVASGDFGYATSGTCGHIKIKSILSKDKTRDILAHDSAVAALTFTHSGDKVASASVRGTLVRVFCVSTGQKLHEFRRGVRRMVAVSDLSFCRNDKFLSLASNTETVHVFKLESSDDSWMSYFSSVARTAVPFGSVVDTYVNQERALATAKLPTSGTGKACSVIYIENKPYVVVASPGIIYVFDLPENSEQNEKCNLLCHHRLCIDDDEEEPCNLTITSALSVAATSSTSYFKWKKGLEESKTRPYASTDRSKRSAACNTACSASQTDS